MVPSLLLTIPFIGFNLWRIVFAPELEKPERPLEPRKRVDLISGDANRLAAAPTRGISWLGGSVQSRPRQEVLRTAPYR
jgi:hypothetical protein